MDIAPGHMVIVIGGPPVARALVADLPGAATVVAADSGADLAHALGWRVDIAVGDFDSITPEALARVEADGGEVRRFPVDKNAIDLELALDIALDAGAHVTIVGGGGGRVDHHLANQLALCAPAFAPLCVEHRTDAATSYVLHGGRHRAIEAAPGTTFSVLPVHGPAEVTVTGAQWPLDRFPLHPGTTRGVSNVANAPFSITCHEGVVLVIVPHQEEAP